MKYYVELSHCYPNAFPCGRLLSLDSRGHVIKADGCPSGHTACEYLNASTCMVVEL